MSKWIVLVAAAFLPQALWAADVPATLQWSQRVELTTPVSGIVKAVSVDVGDTVKKGQVLLTLDSTTFRAMVAGDQSEITRYQAKRRRQNAISIASGNCMNARSLQPRNSPCQIASGEKPVHASRSTRALAAGPEGAGQHLPARAFRCGRHSPRRRARADVITGLSHRCC